MKKITFVLTILLMACTSEGRLRTFTAPGQKGLNDSVARRIKGLLVTCEDFKLLYPDYHRNLVNYNRDLNVYYIKGEDKDLCGQFVVGFIDTIEVYSNWVADLPPEHDCGLVKTTAHEIIHASGLRHETYTDIQIFNYLVNNCVVKRYDKD